QYFDALVKVATVGGGYGTGSLFVATNTPQGYGHHILTAGHVVNLAAGGITKKTATLAIPRPAYPDGVSVAITVPADVRSQPYYSPTTSTTGSPPTTPSAPRTGRRSPTPAGWTRTGR